MDLIIFYLQRIDQPKQKGIRILTIAKSMAFSCTLQLKLAFFKRFVGSHVGNIAPSRQFMEIQIPERKGTDCLNGITTVSPSPGILISDDDTNVRSTMDPVNRAQFDITNVFPIFIGEDCKKEVILAIGNFFNVRL